MTTIVESYTRSSEGFYQGVHQVVTFRASVETMDGAIYTTHLSARTAEGSYTRFDNFHSEQEAMAHAVPVLTLSPEKAIEYVKVRPKVV